jgi:hypothetical protein
MGRLGSSGIGLTIVSSGFENILRKTSTTSPTVCVSMHTFTYAVRPRSSMWLPENALNTGKRRNPNVAIIGRQPATARGAFGGCEQGGAFTGGCAAVVDPYGMTGTGGRGPSILLATLSLRRILLATHPRRAKPGGSECHLPQGLRFPTEEGSPKRSRFESDCTLEKRHLGVNRGPGKHGGA